MAAAIPRLPGAKASAPAGGAAAYPYLFSPLRLGRLTLPNRLMVPAMTTNFAEADGGIGNALIGYLVARARGGFGAIVTENIGVHRSGRVMPRMVMADDDRCLPGLARLAQAVKAEGSVLIGQISHAGRQTRSKITGLPLVAPSPIPCPLNREMPHELAADQIKRLELAFVDTASRLAAAGFDGVEIHGAHGYLVGGFLSPYSNRRADAYGGGLVNRLRFLRNILRGIRAQLGDDFPLLVRLSVEEFVDGGLDLEQSVEVARCLEAEGVHALSVSVGVYESFNKLSMITGEPEGQWLELAGRIRAGIALPVIGVGRIKRAAVAEAGIAAGQIDIAAFGRASIADPELPRKIQEGREDDVRWCLGCNVCLGRSARPQTVCLMNPLVGREDLLRSAGRAAVPRNVTIHGSCLAALTAAWVAAERGHRVAVIEGEGEAGGMQAWRARVPGQVEHAEVLLAARRRAMAAGVRFLAGLMQDAEGDAVWRVRRFEPVDRERLDSLPNAVSSYDLLARRAAVPTGARTVVLGDDLASAEAALVAAIQGARVTLVISGAAIATDAHPGYREITLRKLNEAGATIVGRVGDLPPADLFAIGHGPAPSRASPAAWAIPAGKATAYLDDAYEPGMLTAGVYDAVALALSFDVDAFSSPFHSNAAHP